MRKISNVCFLFIFFVSISIAQPQKYKVDFTPLSFDLFTGDKLVICILEEDRNNQVLFDGLSKHYDFKGKFTCFSTDNLYVYKDVLKMATFDPENKNFLKFLNEELLVEYLLEWKSIPGEEGVFQLTIFSTEKYDTLYSNKFYPSVGSNPILDVKKLLVENLAPVYTLPLGKLEINGSEEIVYKLFKEGELIKEWKGKERLKTEVSKYKLVSEAEGFISDERKIEVFPEQLTTVEIKLEPDLTLLPKVYSLDKKISNIGLRLERKQLQIFYDLVTEDEDNNIKLILVDKTTNNSSEPEQVSGDIKNVKPGRSRLINWEFGKELGDNSSLKNYEIKMSAEKKGGIAWYIYAGGGVAVVGGLVAILAGGGGDNGPTPPPPTKIGTPPARP